MRSLTTSLFLALVFMCSSLTLSANASDGERLFNHPYQNNPPQNSVVWFFGLVHATIAPPLNAAGGLIHDGAETVFGWIPGDGVEPNGVWDCVDGWNYGWQEMTTEWGYIFN